VREMFATRVAAEAAGDSTGRRDEREDLAAVDDVAEVGEAAGASDERDRAVEAVAAGLGAADVVVVRAVEGTADGVIEALGSAERAVLLPAPTPVPMPLALGVLESKGRPEAGAPFPPTDDIRL